MKTIFAILLTIIAAAAQAQSPYPADSEASPDKANEGIQAAQPQPQYVVAVKEQKDCKLSDGVKWNLEIGEVFPFLGYEGGSTSGASVRVQVDDKILVAPTKCFQGVPDDQIATAAMNYKKLVEEYRKNSSVDMETMMQTMQTINSLNESSNRQLLQQMEMLNSIQGMKGRRGGRGNAVMPNGVTANRSTMEQAVFQAGLTRTLYDARRMSDENLSQLYPQALQIIAAKSR